jgi:hypothetical protein
VLLSKFPRTLIIVKSETAKQNRTNFESKFFLSFLSLQLVSEKSPSVSITNIDEFWWSESFSLKYVPYNPRVHLPSLTEKSQPNKKLSKVDLPELWGPKIETTKQLSLIV